MFQFTLGLVVQRHEVCVDVFDVVDQDGETTIARIR